MFEKRSNSWLAGRSNLLRGLCAVASCTLILGCSSNPELAVGKSAFGNPMQASLMHPDDGSEGFVGMTPLSKYDLINLQWVVFDVDMAKPTELEAIAGADIYEVFISESYFDEGEKDPSEWDASLARKIATRAGRLGSPVWVIGYTDQLGSPDENKRLSLSRAKVVASLLKNAGIDQTQIRIAGAGISKKYDEDFKNRRVEILIRPLFSGV